MVRSIYRRLAIGALTLGGWSGVSGQERAIDFSYGRWWHEDGGYARTFTASLRRPLFGTVAYGVGVTHVDDRLSSLDRTQSGGEVSVLVSGGNGLYGVAGGGLGLRHDDGKLDAQWSAGGGYALRPLPVLRLGVEARYRVEDERVRGFWRLDPGDRRGLMLQASVALRLGRSGSSGRSAPVAARSGPTRAAVTDTPPTPDAIVDFGRSAGSDASVAELAASVVQTAIDVMGTPYQWGGTDANGFDCSGLIQYAYSEHDILLPRVSRDQIRQGLRVDVRTDALRPGDILGFSAEGGGVSHVGLYVGEGQFIHSSSEGVQLSSLTAADGNSRWWLQRWVAARRILN